MSLALGLGTLGDRSAYVIVDGEIGLPRWSHNGALRRSGLALDPLRHSRANAIGPRSLTDTHSGRQRLANSCLSRAVDPRASQAFSLRFGRAQPSSHTLLNHGPLKLAEHAHHLKHSLARGRRGVQTLLVQVQVDPNRVDLRQESDQILEGAPKPIDRPSHNHVELALGSVPTERVELRALVPALGAADAMVPIRPW